MTAPGTGGRLLAPAAERVAEPAHRGPPVVTVRGGPVEPAPEPRAAAPLRAGALVLAGVVLVLAVLQGQREEQPRRERRAAVPVAALRLVSDGVSVSRGGVLVVPVALQDLGTGIVVTSARAYAEPVREDPVVHPPDRLAVGQAQRFVVLLSPDCRLLGAPTSLAFRASVLLQVEQDAGRLPLVLDVGSDASVARVVDGLCRRS